MAYAYAKSKGIVILDTKFEDGEVDGMDMLVDEAITPDSSRFVEIGDLERSLTENRDPQFLDKEPVRIWGRTVPTPFFDKQGQPLTGINKLEPENPDHVEFVHSLVVPEEVLRDASSRYLGICEAITGMHVADYQAKYLLA
jgi:phosphoribosylaminoimidazole-succinocarboxamide synthase